MSLRPTLEIRGLSGHPASAPSGRSAALACNPLRRKIGGLLVGGGPAGQQCERGGRGGPLGGVDEQLPARSAARSSALEQQSSRPRRDGRSAFAGRVAADVVRTPLRTERITEGGQLPDQVLQILVVGVTAGFGPQDRDRRGHAVQPVTAIQSEYNLWWRRPEQASSPRAQNSASGSSRSARSAKASSPAPSTPPPPSPPTTFAPKSHDSPAKRSNTTSPSSKKSGPSPPPRASRPDNRPGLAARPAAVDRAYLRHNQSRPARGEPRGRRRHPQ
jgi:hypothetical protein